MPNVYTFKDFEGSSHRILIDLIRRYARRGGTLLDLGAAAGELGAAVRDHFSRTLGFEYQVDCIGDLGRRFDCAVVTDLEQVKRLPENLDAVVCADVIEHLRDPPAALGLIRSALREDGHAFISVPNVANITVRASLLFGMFNYQERGILDQTHLRFYTKRTFRRELEQAGFEIAALRGSSIPVRLVIGSFTPEPILRVIEKLLTTITPLWPSLFAYQIVAVARPR